MTGAFAAARKPSHRTKASPDLNTDVPLISDADRAQYEADKVLVGAMIAREFGSTSDISRMLGVAFR